MEFEGKVIEILPPVSGQSARGTWERQTVVFEQPNKQYGKEIAVTFMNKGQEVATLRVGEMYTVSFDIESRNYQGRWYTDVRAWRVQPLQPAAQPPVQDMPPFMEEPQQSYSAGGAGVIDDMPF
ncbi:MAG: DUF3127 domain-containing protein [Alistipes sp.]|nr:DUF3127 domain-containing protein [Rikenellaceae bacterium]MBO7315426.1 DUF3127 domain-containing protein [Alistipes sp.]MBQ2958482.1 DUF3127 domain-containing protein [Alistipes sp.]MBQ2958799.1 DUF3127 domain-containing protein [Alistipes sp.]MBR2110018.1 DUF3127 domain-containing protein [Alistipes sp.]